MKNNSIILFSLKMSFMLALTLCACTHNDEPQLPDTPETGQPDTPGTSIITYGDPTVWSGDTARFEQRFYYGGYSLFALNDHEAGSTYISAPSTALRGAQWDFRFQLNGKEPTPTTRARVYLSSNQSDLSNSLQGYFLALGISNATLTGDPEGQYLALCRQNGLPNDTAIIFDCHSELLLAAYTMLRLRVCCDEQGKWELFANLEGQPTLSLWGSGTDTTYTHSSHLGFFCTYSRSRSQNYAFGDLKVEVPSASQ
ncbi:MAG: hypothetical protein ACOYJE_08760 [Bacteroidaceae bacterium]